MYLDQARCFTEVGPQGLKCWEDEEAKGRQIKLLVPKPSKNNCKWTI